MIIKIKNLNCKTIIGVYAAEKHTPQTLVINLAIDYAEDTAPHTDNINNALNYHEVTNKVRALVESSRYELLEKLNNEIGKVIMSYPKVRSCQIEIDKPEAPIEGIDSVSVTGNYNRNKS